MNPLFTSGSVPQILDAVSSVSGVSVGPFPSPEALSECAGPSVAVPLPVRRAPWQPPIALPFLEQVAQFLHAVEGALESSTDVSVRWGYRCVMESFIPFLLMVEERFGSSEPLTEAWVLSAWEMAWPDIGYMFTEKDIPDCGPFLLHLNFGKVMKPKKPSSVGEAFVHKLNAALPGRGAGLWEDFPPTEATSSPHHEDCWGLLRSIVVCSLLGAWPGCPGVPSFRVRLLLYRYTLLQPLSHREFMEWGAHPDQASLFLYALREFMDRQLADYPGMWGALQSVPSWVLSMRHTCARMEELRVSLVVESPFRARLPCDGHEPMPSLKRRCPVPSARHRLLGGVGSLCRSFEGLEGLSEKACMEHVGEHFGLFFLPLVAQLFPQSAEQCDALLKESFACVVGGAPPETLGGGSSSMVWDRLKGSFDRWLLYGLLKAYVLSTSSPRVYVLPTHIVKAQVSALCRKYRKRTACELPTGTGTFFWSPVCGFTGYISCGTRTLGDKKKGVYARGTKDVVMDPPTRRVFCFHKGGKSKRRNMTTKRCSWEMLQTRDLPQKVASRNGGRQPGDVCKDVPCRSVHLVGYVIEDKHGCLAVCVGCGQPCYLRSDALFLCAGCQSGVGRPSPRHCFACSRVKRPDDSFVAVDAYNDLTPGQEVYCTIDLCPKCQRHWILKGHKVFPLTEILRGLTERWKDVPEDSLRL